MTQELTRKHIGASDEVRTLAAKASWHGPVLAAVPLPSRRAPARGPTALLRLSLRPYHQRFRRGLGSHPGGQKATGAPPWGWAMLSLAAAISYSRIYVGVHYPSDVAAGLFLGIACGWIGIRWTFRRRRHVTPRHLKKPENTRGEVPEVKYQLERW